MFEISNRGMTEFLELKNLGIIDHTCVYDFSFENRYLIYHHMANERAVTCMVKPMKNAKPNSKK